MATTVTVDLYRQTTTAGVTAITEIGQIDVNSDQVIYMFSGEVEDNLGNPNFKVVLKNGKTFRTNWAGVSAIRNVTTNERANQYVRVKQLDGTYLLTYTGNGYFTAKAEVSTMEFLGAETGDNDGDPVDCWKVVLTNGFTFFTDQEDRDNLALAAVPA